ncbi:hypothetical protein [Modicisalibacter xianhensis]|uniref:Conjugal transfer pilus assembly protein TraW n=1 Tax=Modicisalibacter xianhensis TaxID=442341 RepID=A0A1I3EL89_9GAMM|nr:hypothetical protein [Halomonas xianhensis]SFH99739.1 conjugal transfer pilus assembly protein TraW [Halomonas xianhensis]
MENVVQYSKIAALSVALSAAAIPSAALASEQDLGVLGPTWEIIEPDMRLAIVAEARGVDWGAVNEHLAEQAQNHTRDIPDWFVPIAEHTETHFVDPSYTLGEDIEALKRQPDGTYQWGVIYEAGTKVNPLEHMQPESWLLVVDLRADEQRELAKSLKARHPANLTVIVTAGDPGDLASDLGQAVYFAEEWHFDRLGITHTPSLAGVRDSRPDVIEVTHFAYPYDATTLEEYLP